MGRPRAGGELIGRPIRQSGLNMNLDFVGGPFRASERIFFDANSYALNAVPPFMVGADHRVRVRSLRSPMSSEMGL